MSFKRFALNGLLSLSLLMIVGIAQSKNQIEYLIEIDQPIHHLANISIRVPKGHSTINLKLPNWRTGNYHIINQSNGIRNFEAKSLSGKKLRWKRVDKSSWKIINPSEKAVRVSYLLYANELGKRTRHIDETHAYLDATAVLMYETSLMALPHVVKLDVPKKWRSFSGLTETKKHTFLANNYDQLADSPIEVGINDLVEFSKDGRDYQIVFWGKANRSYLDIASDIKQMLTASQTIWKGYPFKKYVFMIHATSGAGGATEHVNSTVIQRSRDLFAKKDDYLNKFLRTAAHEFVHTWNVKAYRPQGLVPYDYQKENNTDLLWMAEGSTSYLQDRLLLVSELESVKDYLKELSKRVHKFQHKPGTQVQSVSQSSSEQWIAQGGDFANNYSVNIYSEGFMATWLLDFKMLKESGLKVSVRDLHQSLFEDQQQQKLVVAPYDSQLIKQRLKKITNNDYQKWWNKNINKPLDIDFGALLDQAGLKFKKLKDKDHKVWTGFSSKAVDGLITINKVERNSPAWNAGLTTGDQLLAVNGYKVTQKNLDKWLKQFKNGTDIKVTFFREQQLSTVDLKLSTTTKEPRVIELNDDASDAQKAFFKAWLGIDFPDKKEDKKS